MDPGSVHSLDRMLSTFPGALGSVQTLEFFILQVSQLIRVAVDNTRRVSLPCTHVVQHLVHAWSSRLYHS